MNNDTLQPIADLLAANQPLFRALGDVERQHIIMTLACEQHISVGELASRTHLSRPAVSHHLRILKEAGLLRETREGVKRYYTPTFEASIEAMSRLMELIVHKRELW